MGHPPGAFPVHLQQDVSTPVQKEMKVRSLFERGRIHPIRGMIATAKKEDCDLVTFVRLQSPEDTEKKESRKKGLNTLSCHHYTLASPQR